jgi:hypothetical protein
VCLKEVHELVLNKVKENVICESNLSDRDCLYDLDSIL